MTYENYNGAFKFTWEHGVEINRSVFLWEEGEWASLMVKMVKKKKGESFLKKCSAVVTLLLELAGFASLVGGSFLRMIKNTAIKRMNEYKEKRVRRGATLRDISKFIKEIYIEKKNSVSLERKRFLVLFLLLFFGIRRFGDVNKLKLKDINFKNEGEIEFWIRKTKTDTLGRGRNFSICEDYNTGISMKGILRWYLADLKLRKDDYIFFRNIREGKVNSGEFLRYREARMDLINEQAKLGITGLTLHSGRIGGATEAAAAGIGRVDIKELGNWRSDAVDRYIRPKGRIRKVSRALLKGLKI